MKLPLSSDPYFGIDRETRTPVRTNINPRVYDHIFKQLCPLHGIQAQILAHVLNKLHATILNDPLLDPYRITKPDGTIAFFYDEGVLRDLAAIVERCSFDLRPADCGVDRETDREHDGGRTEGVRDAPADPPNVRPDAESKVSFDSEGFKRLAQAIFKGEG